MSRPTALAVILLALASTGSAPAEGFAALGPTHLVDLRVGSEMVDRVAEAATDFELSDGTPAGVPALYRSRLRDLSVLMLTEVSPRTGILWGVALGDRGEKYRIDPSVRLGLIHTDSVGPNLTISARMSVKMGGHLRERPCLADYGEIGGVQTVNCRLAASALAPEDTLPLMFDGPPPDRIEASITLTWLF